MFSKILIANRGEIACRVAATCRRLGIRTVAVYSDADADARHVAFCDEAVHIGGAAARDSYLRADHIIEMAKEAGAQAIHPGYGFLSENEAFAEACAAAGLVFIGPPASAIHAMGSKSAAKQLMEKAAVPLVPGYHGEDQGPALLRREADRIGYPVLLKASAGGGGKGMRVVESGDAFEAALASVKREASASFGDDKVLVEKYLTRPRHIEIQVFADTHGNCVYLFERDCSVQRRHQKVLEEAPAPGMTEARRRAMGEAAVAAAKAVGYVGAGTVEFIANQDGSFYFMEMNTRLQVEHPVTEMITGQDLVEWQLRVAAGEALPLTQDQLRIDGHALEARIYAENPDKQFLPSTGTLRFLRTPPAVQFMRGEDVHGPAGIRIDAGVREGDTISPFYDPMIAKLIVWGKDRDEALARMRQALASYHVVGLSTNVAFLQRLVSSQAFRTADLDTGLIERNEKVLFPPPAPVGLEVIALAVAALFDREARERRIDAADQHSPWTHGGAWRLNGGVSRTLRFGYGEQVLEVTLSTNERGSTLIYADQAAPFACTCQADDIRINLGTRRAHGQVHADGETFHVFYAGRHVSLAWLDPLAHAGETESEGGKLTAPMPGKVIAVMVEAGSTVTRGTPLLVMEAMKMEHTISAPVDGVVSEVLYRVGEQVVEGAQLLAFEGKSGA
ncbi:Acetyl/propionyl-CoA carboxylase, alpha subunit [Cupriavidus necator]|uniref:Acetyl/propionyl/methylcrotonyl-CoA carboxylase subunit alpha n=2 Tax=Cupriavidus necator TaxID=106590 RepID=Q0KF85_CUPNH|nr:acetyl/propionyl/methylcrotonyl-CoA carboxylase subunit alpha [Cupriavidus necator]QCB99296.1 acetyl/propionyl/methylcrotonyl-CoA carboxylase subunit alpha [Cupriavidus necator H16]QQB77886.1 acetyl/propionyl/methylcrotonyl-CoA carboxylase subunit alpha [Cupriavidus necator]WKA41124.1 acetyl/propionyl/methylcrotonyl-CoA carboxylase subunit alpha [Cupriavidus necator]CAJ91336.1 biotin carboxylase [Cupriavidus necator H16]